MKSMVGRITEAGRLLVTNPRLFFLKIYATLRSLYPLSKYPILKKINGINFEFDFSYDAAIKHMYTGTYEAETVQVMKRFLKEGDTFVDIGSNVGYLSAIAAGFVGTRGQVHSFEPVPKYFSKLQNVALLNSQYNIKPNQFALGEKDGVARISITNLPNIGWNTIVPGFMSKDTTKESIEVSVRKFDDYARENSLNKVSLIKVDTEGFEFPVLKGFSRFFDDRSILPIVICEIAPMAYSFLGCTLEQLSQYMRGYSYEAFEVTNISKKIDILALKKTTNVIFIHSR
ncbi:MAG: FkbM family methyltransferase [PVC group bacterium]|nr:FkbM family methyltransferase [PVC group bacterium]